MRLHPLVRRWDKFPAPYRLVDAEEAARRHPGTFHRNTRKEMSAIQVDWYVKVCVGLPHALPHSGERFWIRITLITPRFIVGLVSNELKYVHPQFLRYGSVIAIQRKHIFEVKPPDAADPIRQESTDQEPESNVGYTYPTLHMPETKLKLN